MLKSSFRGAADLMILFIIVGAMLAAAVMTGDFPTRYDDLLPTPIPTPTRKPTPTKSPPSTGSSNTAPTSTTCGGKYSLNNLIGANFGDPNGKKYEYA